jgi:hypothetical protein
MQTFRVSVCAHLGTAPRPGLNRFRDALLGAEFDLLRGDLVYRDVVEARNEGVASRILAARVKYEPG